MDAVLARAEEARAGGEPRRAAGAARGGGVGPADAGGAAPALLAARDWLAAGPGGGAGGGAQRGPRSAPARSGRRWERLAR
ncbi:MAG: hypothetical protein R3F59_28130 [Myxococcota bacterium]